MNNDNCRYFTELIWRCMMRKHLEKLLAIILGCMSVAILLAEATLLPSGLDLSLFSILINSVGQQEMLVQVASKSFFFFNLQKNMGYSIWTWYRPIHVILDFTFICILIAYSDMMHYCAYMYFLYDRKFIECLYNIY